MAAVLLAIAPDSTVDCPQRRNQYSSHACGRARDLRPARCHCPPSPRFHRIATPIGVSSNRYLTDSTPRSRQIFFAGKSSISRCRGIAERRLLRSFPQPGVPPAFPDQRASLSPEMSDRLRPLHSERLFFCIALTGSGQSISPVEGQRFGKRFRKTPAQLLTGPLLAIDAWHFLDPAYPPVTALFHDGRVFHYRVS